MPHPKVSSDFCDTPLFLLDAALFLRRKEGRFLFVRRTRAGPVRVVGVGTGLRDRRRRCGKQKRSEPCSPAMEDVSLFFVHKAQVEPDKLICSACSATKKELQNESTIWEMKVSPD